MKIQMTIDADVVRQQSRAVGGGSAAEQQRQAYAQYSAAVEQSRGIGNAVHARSVACGGIALGNTAPRDALRDQQDSRLLDRTWIAHDPTDDSVCPVPDVVKEIKVAFRNGSVSQWSCFRAPQEWRRNRIVAGAAAKPGEWDIMAWHVVYLDAKKIVCG